jgi:hypothetical protein
MALSLSNAISHANTFQELDQIAGKVETTITWWGRRSLEVSDDHKDELSGRVKIDAILERGLELRRLFESTLSRLSGDERHAAGELSKKITAHLAQDEGNIRQRSCIFRFFSSLVYGRGVWIKTWDYCLPVSIPSYTYYSSPFEAWGVKNDSEMMAGSLVSSIIPDICHYHILNIGLSKEETEQIKQVREK